jgi:gentisate 1,2-dioxygenase
MADVTPEDFNRAGNMDELLGLLAKVGIENGWAKREPSMYSVPKQNFVGAHWSYAQARAALEAAGRFVNTELAERRNLILNNPVPGNFYPTVTTLVSAYQMVKAGERARSHRHTANAMRFVLEGGPDMYTIVDGKKIPMMPNDVLLTPNWSWHAHWSDSKTNSYWIDFLDVPLTHLVGPMFFDHHQDLIEKTDIVDPHSPARFAFEDTVKKLAVAPEIAPGCRRIELGSPAMKTIAIHVTRLDPGASFSEEPSTLSRVFAMMQGEATAVVDGRTFETRRGDVVAAPSSLAAKWTAKNEVYLLRVSDEPLLRYLDWLRPIAGNA